MKNNKTWVGISLGAIILAAIFSYAALRDSGKTSLNSITPSAFDPLNATYNIENTSITLVNGRSTDNLTSVFGVPTLGDLNNDGKDDAAFILTQNTGGSGTFFYLASAINSPTGTFGTSAFLLGDRIAPQNIEIKDEQIIANYADRKPGEPMTAQPSVGVSKYFNVAGNTLSEVHPFSHVTNRTWKWMSTKMSDDTTIVPKKNLAFTIHFNDNQTVNGTTDCNSFGGNYTAADGKLAFGSLASTLMYCAGSQEADFLEGINAVESYILTTNNKLILQLKMDSGSMIFE